MQTQELVDGLEKVVGNLKAGDQSFAESLIAQYKRRGGLSEKQVAWVSKLTERALAPPRVEQLDCSLAPVVQSLVYAGSKLKYPKVRLLSPAGKDLVVYIAGERSKYSGNAVVVSPGSFEDRTYYGRVDQSGQFFKSNSADQDVVEILKRFASAPAETAAQYGKLTGNCCFCGRKLSDEKSLKNGYGPVCAVNYGIE